MIFCRHLLALIALMLLSNAAAAEPAFGRQWKQMIRRASRLTARRRIRIP